MGLFKRVECNEEAEQPSMSAAELEQMVYATYQEKLDLAKQLDGAKARIESLEETLQEKTTKLRAAEEFARQSESERKKHRIKDRAFGAEQEAASNQPKAGKGTRRHA